MTHRLLVGTAALLLLTAPLSAQRKSSGAWLQTNDLKTFGVMAGVNMPTGDLGEVFGTGWTLGVQGTMGRGKYALIGEIAYSSFPSDFDEEILENRSGGALRPSFSRAADVDYSTNLNIWNFAVGARSALGPIYVGGLLGYWTEVDDFDIVPLAGIHVWKLDLGARWKGLLGDGDWFGFSAAFHFGKAPQ